MHVVSLPCVYVCNRGKKRSTKPPAARYVTVRGVTDKKSQTHTLSPGIHDSIAPSHHKKRQTGGSTGVSECESRHRQRMQEITHAWLGRMRCTGGGAVCERYHRRLTTADQSMRVVCVTRKHMHVHLQPASTERGPVSSTSRSRSRSHAHLCHARGNLLANPRANGGVHLLRLVSRRAKERRAKKKSRVRQGEATRGKALTRQRDTKENHGWKGKAGPVHRNKARWGCTLKGDDIRHEKGKHDGIVPSMLVKGQQTTAARTK